MELGMLHLRLNSAVDPNSDNPNSEPKQEASGRCLAVVASRVNDPARLPAHWQGYEYWSGPDAATVA